MKKIFTPEVKIALVAIVGIVVLFFGMQFLKGLTFSLRSTYTKSVQQRQRAVGVESYLCQWL